jgi:3-oxoacyl-[acyl-carrier protein] reductase
MSWRSRPTSAIATRRAAWSTTAAEHFGSHVTTVVNNALGDFSFNGDGRETIQSIPWEDFQGQLDVSLRGALNLIQATARPWKARASAG